MVLVVRNDGGKHDDVDQWIGNALHLQMCCLKRRKCVYLNGWNIYETGLMHFSSFAAQQ